MSRRWSSQTYSVVRKRLFQLMPKASKATKGKFTKYLLDRINRMMFEEDMKKMDKRTGGWHILINVNNGHNKFWAVKIVDSDKAMVRWGKIGTFGASREFPIAVAGSRYYSKMKTGYKQVEPELMRHLFSDSTLALWEL